MYDSLNSDESLARSGSPISKPRTSLGVKISYLPSHKGPHKEKSPQFSKLASQQSNRTPAFTSPKCWGNDQITLRKVPKLEDFYQAASLNRTAAPKKKLPEFNHSPHHSFNQRRVISVYTKP